MNGIGTALVGGATVGLILVWIGVILFWPFFVIWALNTLFGFAIAFTFKTWASALVLCATVKASASSSK